MSKYLANLLSKETFGFKKFIDDIEIATGHKKNDLKLSSFIKQSTDQKIRSLGLNPRDTTAEELYFALNNLVKLHDKFITEKIGSKYGDPALSAMDQIATIFNKSDNRQIVFSIKSSTAKKILTKNQPQLMPSLLGYRSPDSMLKNEDPKTLLSLAFYNESEAWQNRYLELLRDLSANDFEFQNTEVVVLNKAKFKRISQKIIFKNGHNVIALENTGQILIAQIDTKLKAGFCLLTYAYITNRLKMMIKFSTFVQNQKFNSNFGEIIYKLSLDTDLINFYLSKYSLSWDSIADLTSSMNDMSDEVKETILFREQSNNIDKLDKILINLEPALHFWYESDNLGYKKDQSIVSLNLLDACYNSYNDLSLDKSSHVFMQASLNRTLISRYLDSKISNEQIMKQINSSPEENEFIQVFRNRVVYS